METDLLIIGLALVLSAFFSGSEIAFVSTNRLRIELKGSADNLSSRILTEFVKRPSHFITGLLVGNNIAMVVYGIYFAKILTQFWKENQLIGYQNEFSLFFLQTVLGSMLVLIVAEFIPKALSSLSPYKVLHSLAIPLVVFSYPIRFIVDFIVWLSHVFIEKVLRTPIIKETDDYDRIDLFHIISEESKHEKKENDNEVDTEIFMNALEFAHTKVRDCMVPRPEIDAVELEEGLQRLKEIFIETGRSKILIYKENIDNIIGYVHSIDFYGAPKSIKSILMPLSVATESMPASVLLQDLIDNRRSIACVVDEFGGTAGIVTVEDIIEEIFGEIEDEHDDEQLTEEVIGENKFKFSARLETEYLNDKYDLNIPEGDYDTLGGFVISEHESIPEQGDTMILDTFRLTILKMSGARIDEVELEVLNEG